jgi:UDP-glucose 4-epimerase
VATTVVTGGSGFVGSRLVERLVERGDDVVVYDVAPLPPDLACGAVAVRKVDGDVRDASALARAIEPGVDVVYHLSAMVGVDRYLLDPLDVIDVAVLGTRNVLQRAADVGAKVLLASTSEIYGRNPQAPWRESSDRVLGSTAVDRWSYSSSKAVAEHMTHAYARQFGLAAAIVRYFNVYGPRQRPAYLISKTLHRALRGLPPLLYDTGTQTRCFTFVDDAVEATVLAAARASASVDCFNVGSDEEVSVRDAVRLATRAAGRSLEPIVVDTDRAFARKYEDIPRRVPDTSKARALLRWRYETSLEDGLERTVEWARRSPWWLGVDSTSRRPSQTDAGEMPKPSTRRGGIATRVK